jgi:hypothetical protein
MILPRRGTTTMNHRNDFETADPQLLRRATLAETNSRQVNEAIERDDAEGAYGLFLCECGHVGCSKTIRIPLADYEKARAGFERFVLAPGHEITAVDEVLERKPHFLLVAKREGLPRAIAHTTDPRGDNDDR